MSAARCKPGDLAVIIDGRSHIGKCVTVERLATHQEVLGSIKKHSGYEGFNTAHDDNAVIWRIDLPVLWAGAVGRHPCMVPYHVDQCLMPITPPKEMADDEARLERVLEQQK